MILYSINLRFKILLQFCQLCQSSIQLGSHVQISEQFFIQMSIILRPYSVQLFLHVDPNFIIIIIQILLILNFNHQNFFNQSFSIFNRQYFKPLLNSSHQSWRFWDFKFTHISYFTCATFAFIDMRTMSVPILVFIKCPKHQFLANCAFRLINQQNLSTFLDSSNLSMLILMIIFELLISNFIQLPFQYMINITAMQSLVSIFFGLVSRSRSISTPLFLFAFFITLPSVSSFFFLLLLLLLLLLFLLLLLLLFPLFFVFLYFLFFFLMTLISPLLNLIKSLQTSETIYFGPRLGSNFHLRFVKPQAQIFHWPLILTIFISYFFQQLSHFLLGQFFIIIHFSYPQCSIHPLLISFDCLLLLGHQVGIFVIFICFQIPISFSPFSSLVKHADDC